MVPIPPAVSRHIPSAKENKLAIRHKKPSSSEQKTEKQLPAKQLPAKSNSVHLTARTKGVLYAVRALSEGDREIQLDHTLSLDEYQSVLSCVKRVPPYDSLKGFWEDKLRYDYDSDTRAFHIRMPSKIHDEMTGKIVRSIDRWLSSLETHPSPTIQQFVRAIQLGTTEDIDYVDRESTPQSLTEAAGPPTPSTAGSQWESPGYQGSSRSSGQGSSRGQPDRLVKREPSTQPIQQAPKETEKHFCSDNAWRFDYGEVADDQPAFVVETKKSQSSSDLNGKIKTYFEKCNVVAVLVCKPVSGTGKRATMELWVNYPGNEENRQKNPRWHVDLLDGKGAIPVNGSTNAIIPLQYFASRSTIQKYFKEVDARIRDDLKNLPALTLDLRELGSTLLSLRAREEEKLREKKRGKKRQREESSDEEEKDWFDDMEQDLWN